MCYAIETTNLTKVKCCDDVNIHVSKGAIYGLVGPSGSGKSAILKLICGIQKPTKGEIKIFGNINDKFSSKKVAGIFDNGGLIEDLTAYENMKYRCIVLGINRFKLISKLLEWVQIDINSKAKVSTFSLDEKQRLLLAITLLGSPDIVVLDEPLDGLDPKAIKEYCEMIIYLVEKIGLTVIFSSSHLVNDIQSFATHFGIINDGKLIAELSYEELEKECRHYIELKVDNTSKAISVLEMNLNINDYKVMPDNVIRIYSEDIESFKINKELIMENVKVKEIRYCHEDFSKFFIERMEGIDNA